MISIIIPSRSAEALKSISQNIAKTIGVPFEIIDYNNSDNGFGICKIYNLCAQKAKYENLVFCHDDIIFHSSNWGYSLLEVLNISKIGLIGVCGATYKSKYPAPWVSIPKGYYRSNLFEKNSKQVVDEQADFEKVAVVDGCFLSMRKEIWNEFKFNETELKGFHIYDIDISVRIGKKYDVVVEKSFEIEHLSEGVFNHVWYGDSFIYHKNNKELFPAKSDGGSDEKYLDGYALKSLILRSPKLKMKRAERLAYLLSLLKSYPNQFSLRLLKTLK
ncbi:glycosyltransferase [Formosa sp. L2A11]|uniref:glycosyltransferase n=1 Tax=Formosa sp. L2A11 TaxID=2686363 RepID=UPI00131C757B|nr:glycosyltransferase [Formosa sp. L2A11]